MANASKIDELIQVLEDEHAETGAAKLLKAALGSRETHSHQALSEMFGRLEYPVSEAAVRRWRKSHGV